MSEQGFWLARAVCGLFLSALVVRLSSAETGCFRVAPAHDWRNRNCRLAAKGPLGGGITISPVTTREKARAVLDRHPGDRMKAALAALEAVEGRDPSVEAILARQGEQRLDPQEFERQFVLLPTDDEG